MIFLKLIGSGGSLNEKLMKLSQTNLTLADAKDEVQQRAATSLIVLTKEIDKVNEFTKAMLKAAGTTKEMARVQMDTLKGQLTLLKSAWKGMIIEMTEGEDHFRIMKLLIASIATDLNTLSGATDKVTEAWKDFNAMSEKIIQGMVRAMPIWGQQRLMWAETRKVIDEAVPSVSDMANEVDNLSENIGQLGLVLKQIDFRNLFPSISVHGPLGPLSMEFDKFYRTLLEDFEKQSAAWWAKSDLATLIAGNLQTDIQGILESQTGDKMNLLDHLFDDEELLGDEPVDKLIKQMREATNVSKELGNTVGVALVSSFDDLGTAIGKALGGASDAISELGKEISKNMGNILIMAGINMGMWPLVVAGIAMQIGGGINAELEKGHMGHWTGPNGEIVYDPANLPGNQPVQHTVEFEISGNVIRGALDINDNLNNIGT